MTTTDFHSLLDNGSPEESKAPVALNGRELDVLLSPISCEEFVNAYFSRVSLHIPGTPRKFDHIFGWEQLKHTLARGKKIPDRRYNITASFTSGEASGNSRPMITANHDQVSDLLNAGATICVTNIHMADPCLARWAQALRAQLNFSGTVGVNCYVSPDGSGLPVHYDKRVATTLQIAGKKRWRFSKQAAKEWPDHNALYSQGRIEPAEIDGGKLPAEMEFREVELNPGDLLCLPAGAWHSARGVGVSLALNVYFAPRNFLDQLLPLLHAFANSNGNWRGGPPATLEKIQGQMPENVSRYMRERLDEFHKMALEVLSGPEALAEPWLNSLTQFPFTGWRPDPKLPIPGITPDQRFRIAQSSLRFIETHDGIVVPCDNGLLKFPVAAAPVLYRLSSEPAGFTIPAVLSWQQDSCGPSTDEVLDYLKTLYSNGILEMV
jgi:hypothetical protein